MSEAPKKRNLDKAKRKFDECLAKFKATNPLQYDLEKAREAKHDAELQDLFLDLKKHIDEKSASTGRPAKRGKMKHPGLNPMTLSYVPEKSKERKAALSDPNHPDHEFWGNTNQKDIMKMWKEEPDEVKLKHHENIKSTDKYVNATQEQKDRLDDKIEAIVDLTQKSPDEKTTPTSPKKKGKKNNKGDPKSPGKPGKPGKAKETATPKSPGKAKETATPKSPAKAKGTDKSKEDKNVTTRALRSKEKKDEEKKQAESTDGDESDSDSESESESEETVPAPP